MEFRLTRKEKPQLFVIRLPGEEWQYASVIIFSPHKSRPGSTQALTEMSTMSIEEDKGGRCVGLTTLSTSRADCVEIPGVSTSWNQLDLKRPEQGLPYLLTFTLQ
jgi:hypothetical protein